MGKNREAKNHSPASRPAASSAERQQETAPRVHELRVAKIAQRAYEFHVARGCRHGRDLEDWLDAEREIADAA